VDGVFTVSPTRIQFTSLTPATLSVDSNLVHPVVSFPLQRQTASVQGINSTCGQQMGTVSMRTPPFTPLAAGTVMH